jgi:hypothetical protein
MILGKTKTFLQYTFKIWFSWSKYSSKATGEVGNEGIHRLTAAAEITQSFRANISHDKCQKGNWEASECFTACGLLACHRFPPNMPEHFGGFNALQHQAYLIHLLP